MYLYHFCAIWKLLDIKGRPIILGEPPFLGGDSDVPPPSMLPDVMAATGHSGRAWWHPKPCTQLLLTPLRAPSTEWTKNAPR